jgi:pyruvate ferredoxin oxidoreductase beta subunit
MTFSARDLPSNEYFYGHKACGGCGGSLAVRLALKVLGMRTFAVVPPNCMSTVSLIYPNMAFACNAIIPPFAATAAMMSGVLAGANALGIKDFHVVGLAGDGGTVDIGLQALSGAIDRGDRIIYICYDNEAYMNTGIQKSGLTPYGTSTTTTPAGNNKPGSTRPKKNIFEIVAVHDIPYAATASVGYPEDFLGKLEKAKNTAGPSFIHVLAPCPTGWGISTEQSITIAKEAVDCGLWYLAEYEQGEFFLNRNPESFSPARDYLAKQGRFSHLKERDISIIEGLRDSKWSKIRKIWIQN